MYYTHDGVRHGSKEEAVDYLTQMCISEVPPFEDEYYLALHNQNWGKYEFQAVPDGLGESLYLEMIRWDTEDSGYNLLKFSDMHPPEDVEEVVNYLKKRLPMMDVIRSEMKAHLTKWSLSDSHMHVVDPDGIIAIELLFTVESTIEGIRKTIEYNVDGVFSGMIVIEPDHNIDVIQAILDDLESHLLLEAKGQYSAVTGKLGSVNLDHMLSTASLYNHTLTITVETNEKKVAE